MSAVVELPIGAHGNRAASISARIARLLPAIGIITLVGVTALLFINAAQVVRAGAAAIAYPFELDFAEGLVLTQTHALAAGRSIYPPADAAPATISNYTPVYYGVVALLGAAPADHLAAGRAVSLVCALLAAAALALLAWRAIQPAVGPLVRALAAACAGLAFLQVTYTASFIALMRVDLLAVLLAFVGVLIFGSTAGRGRQVYWCLLPLVLAVYTKQTTVAAAAACMLTAARADRRRGLALGGAFIAAGLLAAAALQLATRGGFLFHIVGGNLHPFRWDQAGSFLQDIAIRYPVLVTLAVAVTPSLLTSLRPGRRRQAVTPADGRAWTRAALGAYLPLAALTAIGVGKLGAEVNYLIELMGVVCACAAVAVGEALCPASSDVDRRMVNGRAVGALAVPLLLLWQVDRLAPATSIESIEVPPPAQEAQVANLVALLRQADGPVLSEDLTLLVRADKPVVFQPFDIAQLMYRHARDEQPLVAALENGRIALIVLHFDVDHPPPLAFNRFTPAILDAIRNHYALRTTFPGYWLYAPRSHAFSSVEALPK